jgi:glycosyltransferase involved in cell wall biosynthesis
MNGSAPTRPRWVLMLLENESYPSDPRVRHEAETLVEAGYRVTVLAPSVDSGWTRREAINGVEVVRFWNPVSGRSVAGFIGEYAIAHLQLARLTLVRLLAGADIVHVNNPPDTLAVLLVLARLLGRRTVFDNHDLFPELFELRYRNRPLAGVLRAFQRLAFRIADLVITTNESQQELVLQSVARDPASVVVVRNGPREDLPWGLPAADHDDGVRRAGLELAFLGALEPQDGVEALAEILSLLVDRHGLDARLTVVGEGSCREALQRRCAELGVGGRVRMVGRVSHYEVPGLLAEADVCVDPAPCNELNHRSTMVKIAEYIASRKPIVAFELRETRRTAGEAALYAPCGDLPAFAALVAELAAAEGLRAELTRRAEERLPELLWGRSAEVLRRAYGSLEPR